MDLELSIERMADRVGFVSRAQAREAFFAALRALGARTLRSDMESVLRRLPAEVSSALASCASSTDDSEGAFFKDVASREGIAVAAAREHAMTACEVLAEALSDDDLALVRRAVAPPLRGLLERRPERPSVLPRVHSYRLHGHTGLRAQSGSVVRSANPHGDRKASSGHVDTTLAEGNPRSSHPASEAGKGR